MRYDHILFDLDGTLTDPLDGIGRSMNYALGHFGYPQLQRDALAPCVGPKLIDSFRRITGSDDEAHLTALVAKYRERYGYVGYAENSVYPGIPPLLERLSAAGVPMAVCTSKRADFAERILTLFGLDGYFRFVDGGDIHIEKWQQVERLRARGAVSDRSVMVGDREFDILAAHRNGMQAAGVLWGYGSRQELSSHQPAHLLATPAEMPAAMGIGDAGSD